MTDNVLDTISHDALYKKSKDFIKRAFDCKNVTTRSPGNVPVGVSKEDNIGYLLWAAISIEFLGKAALAFHHPCLLVDAKDSDSIYVAAGVIQKGDKSKIGVENIRTISAKVVYNRLKDLILDFDETAYRFCLNLAEMRNVELHSAASLFDDMEHDWEKRYWYTCQVILIHMGYSIKDWLGDSSTVVTVRSTKKASNERESIKAKVFHKIELFKQNFMKLDEEERNRISDRAHKANLRSVLNDFDGAYEMIWEIPCPSCDSRSFLGGNETVESLMGLSDFALKTSEPLENYTHTFAPHEFLCIACHLTFLRYDELCAAGLDTTYEHRN